MVTSLKSANVLYATRTEQCEQDSIFPPFNDASTAISQDGQRFDLENQGSFYQIGAEVGNSAGYFFPSVAGTGVTVSATGSFSSASSNSNSPMMGQLKLADRKAENGWGPLFGGQ